MSSPTDSVDDVPSSDVLATALRSIDYIVFEQLEEASFRLHGNMNDWASTVVEPNASNWALKSEFLKHFVEVIAEGHWETGGSGVPLASGIWAESVSNEDIHFEAVALSESDGRRLLMLRKLGRDFDDLQALAQRANQSSIQHYKLSSEMQKKDVLLKCIVHDLNNPLSTMLLSLQQLAKAKNPMEQKLAETALRQARRQRNLIKSVSELFSHDLSHVQATRSSTEAGSGLVGAAADVVRSHQNEALQRSVSIALEDEASSHFKNDESYGAEKEGFQRAIENLVLNALRFAPRDSTVLLRATVVDACLQFRVIDRGPGVEASVVDSLFDPFTQGEVNRGNMGLGLYFCRMTVERWGGSIQYEQNPEGGATFVVTLKPAGTSNVFTNVSS